MGKKKLYIYLKVHEFFAWTVLNIFWRPATVKYMTTTLKKNKLIYLQVVPRHWRCPLLLRAHFLWIVITFVTHVILFSRILSSIHCNAFPIIDIGFALVDLDRGALQVGGRGNLAGSGWPVGGRYFFATTGDCITIGIVAFSADNFGQNSSSGVDKPVAYLM